MSAGCFIDYPVKTVCRKLSIVLVTASAFLLSSCTYFTLVDASPQYRAALDEQHAVETIVVEGPGIAFRDKRYHTRVGDYRSTNIWIKNLKKNKNYKNSSRVVNKTLDNLIFSGKLIPELAFIKRSHRLSTLPFSYELIDQENKLMMKSDCALHDIVDVETEKVLFKKKKKEEKLVGNVVACLIEHNDRGWVLSVYAEKPDPPIIVLESASDYYRFERPVAIKEQWKSNKGKFKVESNPNFYEYVGSQIFFSDGRLVGEIEIDSISGQITLRKDINLIEKQLLTGAGYGLMLSSFISSSWLNREIEDISQR